MEPDNSFWERWGLFCLRVSFVKVYIVVYHVGCDKTASESEIPGRFRFRGSWLPPRLFSRTEPMFTEKNEITSRYNPWWSWSVCTRTMAKYSTFVWIHLFGSCSCTVNTVWTKKMISFNREYWFCSPFGMRDAEIELKTYTLPSSCLLTTFPFHQANLFTLWKSPAPGWASKRQPVHIVVVVLHTTRDIRYSLRLAHLALLLLLAHSSMYFVSALHDGAR